MAKKVTDLREAVSFEGLVALGVDTIKNESVQVPLGFVKQGADAAVTAAQSATNAAEAAVTAAQSATTATEAAVTAAQSATTATEAAVTAAQSATTATEAAVTATETIDTKIATKLNTPTVAAPSVSAISSLVGLNASGSSVSASTDQIREMVGIDYSLLTEQLIPGEYFVGRDGTRKEVYGRLLKLTKVVDIFNGNGYAHWPSVLIADTIAEASGFAELPDRNDKFRIAAVTSGSETSYGVFSIHRDPGDNLYTFGFDTINASYVGRPVELSIFVKYTK